jgi:regulator of nonsense transcripts 3
MTTLAQLNKPGGSSKTDAARTKIVIRRLPPALPEEIFWKSVETWVSDDTASWKQYVAGRVGDE